MLRNFFQHTNVSLLLFIYLLSSFLSSFFAFLLFFVFLCIHVCLSSFCSLTNATILLSAHKLTWLFIYLLYLYLSFFSFLFFFLFFLWPWMNATLFPQTYYYLFIVLAFLSCFLFFFNSFSVFLCPFVIAFSPFLSLVMNECYFPSFNKLTFWIIYLFIALICIFLYFFIYFFFAHRQMVFLYQTYFFSFLATNKQHLSSQTANSSWPLKNRIYLPLRTSI